MSKRRVLAAIMLTAVTLVTISLVPRASSQESFSSPPCSWLLYRIKGS